MRVTDTLTDVVSYAKTHSNFWKTFFRGIECGTVTRQKIEGASAFYNMQVVSDQLETITAKPSHCLVPAFLYSLEKAEKGKYKAILRYNNVEAIASLLDTSVFNLITNVNKTGFEKIQLIEEVIGAHDLLQRAICRFKSLENLRAQVNKCDLAVKFASLRATLSNKSNAKTTVRDVVVRSHSRSRPAHARCCAAG